MTGNFQDKKIYIWKSVIFEIANSLYGSTNISAILRYKEDIGRDAELDIVVKKKKKEKEGVEMKMLRSAKVSIINKALQ